MTDNEDKPDQEIIDAADFDSDILPDPYGSKDVLDDEDEGDEGIFAPTLSRKKKSGSTKATAAAVVFVALLGGGAFYYFNQGKTQETIPAPEITADAVPTDTASPPVSNEVAASDAPASAVSASPDASVPPIGSEPVTPPPANIAADAPPVEAPIAPSEETASPTAPEQPLKSDEAAATPPTETVSTATPPVEPNIEDNVVTPVNDVTPPDSSDLPAPKISEVGENPQLAPPPVNNASTKQSPETDLGKSELAQAGQTIKTEPKKEVPLKYYDSPKGKALLDIPPPSINPMTEPGQSIIIVHKDRTAPAQEAVIEKGEDTQIVEARLTSANRAARIGKDDAAIEFYNQAYKRNPNDPRILMGRAVSYQKVGETEKAIQGYKDVLQIDPNNPEALTNLMGLVGQKKPAVALQNLLTLREKYPRNASVAAQLGVAYAQSGNKEDGLKYLNIAAGLQPENPLHYYNMAVISDQMGDREKAIQYYEQSLDVYSVNGGGSDAEFSREKIYDRLSQLRGSN